MAKSSLLSIGITLILGEVGPLYAQDSPTSIKFQFAPPNGTRVMQVSRLKRVRTVEGQLQVSDESEMSSQGEFKRVGDAFEYSSRIVNASMRRNGLPINDPIVTLLTKVQPTYVISASGEAVEIKGFAQVESLMKATLPPQAAAALASLLSESALVAKEKAEWNGRYAEFAGGEFRIGEIIDSKAAYTLPSGEKIDYNVRTSFSKWEQCPAGRCVRIEQAYESDAHALAHTAQRVVNDLTNSAAERTTPPSSTDPDRPTSRITGALSRLIDPKTMRIYSERLERTLVLPLEISGKGRVASSQREERIYDYTYD